MKNIYFVTSKYVLYIILFFPFLGIHAQETVLQVEGQLIDKRTKDVLPYAHVYNLRTKIGSVTDENGYFGFGDNKIGDTLSVSFIGYIPQLVILDSDIHLQIELQENTQELSEVTLEYDNSDYLYKLIYDCGKSKNNAKAQGKAYYELQSKIDGKQVELVENFYNAKIKGYDLENLKLKVGRLGIQTHKAGGVLLSLESSVAVMMSKLKEDNEYFYKTPFQLSYRQLKNTYDLYKTKTYKEGNDKIIVIRFSPKTKETEVFHGIVWINERTNQILKITLDCEDCKTHPFRVVTHDERRINTVDLHITKTFKPEQEGVVLDHIDFTYQINYSRKQYDINLETRVLIHMYNFNELFYTPKYNATNEFRHSQDYRLIGEAPYNIFFWDNHNEFTVFDKDNTNSIFYNHPNTIKGEELLHHFKTPKNNKERKFFEHPSFTWSKKRLRFAKPRGDSTQDDGKNKEYMGAYNGQFKSEMYKFYGKIYLDRNTYNGKTDVLVESIFDSSRSYYKLPVDWKVQVFVNMYFDLVEIEKRKLVDLIQASDKSIEKVNVLYSQSEARLKETHKKYLKEVERGGNMTAMEKWNTYILKELKINNLEAFIKDE